MQIRRHTQMRWVKSLLALSMMPTLLLGCATALPEMVGAAACPHVTPVSSTKQAEILRALVDLPAGSPLAFVAGDWIKMRDEARACRG